MYVCMYIYVCICMYLCMCVCISLSLYIYIYISVYETNILFRKPPLLGPPLSCAEFHTHLLTCLGRPRCNSPLHLFTNMRSYHNIHGD